MEQTAQQVRPVQNAKGKLVALATVATGTVLTTTHVFALKATDVTTATGAAGGEDSIDAGYLYALGIVVALYIGRKILGVFGR